MAQVMVFPTACGVFGPSAVADAELLLPDPAPR